MLAYGPSAGDIIQTSGSNVASFFRIPYFGMNQTSINMGNNGAVNMGPFGYSIYVYVNTLASDGVNSKLYYRLLNATDMNTVTVWLQNGMNQYIFTPGSGAVFTWYMHIHSGTSLFHIFQVILLTDGTYRYCVLLYFYLF